MKKNRSSKLRLNKQTLRSLSHAALSRACGGIGGNGEIPPTLTDGKYVCCCNSNDLCVPPNTQPVTTPTYPI